MIKTLLIANRGEIAVRIIRTCQRLGIRTVAVYSEADRNALFVEMADRACLIGSSEASASYLRADKIIAVAQKMQVDAIHPGYGFLAESEELIALCEETGITFVGPSRQAIVKMGSKIEAKIIAEAANVPTIPGYHGNNQDPAVLKSAAEKTGFPLLIKASAGGGGKGMRRVDQLDEFDEALSLAKQEAANSFGDDKVLLEKLIVQPRHIEVQLAADKHGNVIHLFERECSIQRNHQKIIEEAPAAFLSDAQKDAIYGYALKLGKAINYDSLGTIECILDHQSGEIYFLEMNTRLQVEHPVTEKITGLDLVELQLRIAAGEPLPLAQSDVKQSGWAIEARLNAEDPSQGYMPEIGEILAYREPVAEGVRVDSGVQEGSSISPFYDPMVVKVIAYGSDRLMARQRLSSALEALTIVGVGTNRAFLRDILGHEQFLSQPLTTNYLEQVFPSGWQKPDTNIEMAALAAAVSHVLKIESTTAGQHASPWSSIGAWRIGHLSGAAGVTTLLFVDEAEETHTICLSGYAGSYCWIKGEQTIPFTAALTSQGALFIELEAYNQRYQITTSNGRHMIASEGDNWLLKQISHEQMVAREQAESSVGGTDIIAVMPGAITSVEKSVGDSVDGGEKVILMEAMKLLHTLCAPTSGTIKGIYCEAGENVDAGMLLVEIEPEE